ncbi:DUF2911 domain-containing protein [Sediminibacterium roseum]|uniref:DUF2911 domain-containing protein n=1 Tax=Sediminibacterium roseum TaxID=1978412 RepID=A0ABW9ZUK0_9BACT|nr:DUF2911 domain-containing protein [Sediminibacterium roseum]NCI49909.1 DUF2911 domain-containing protein [Sediminibacterium roseum]
MKRSLLLVAMLCGISAYSQIRMPAPSPTQKIVQPIGLGVAEVTYSRPALKGRTVFKENSELAPIGKLWRTGANAATRLFFSEKVMMGGKMLDTGSYVLYTIPGKEYWDVVINKGLNNGGTDGYKESEDVNRFRVKAEKFPMEVENFTMQFANLQPESCELQLMWGTTLVRIPMSVTVKDRIRIQVEKALAAETVDPNVYFATAQYYYDWDKNPGKALPLITKATAANPKAYYMFLLQAKIQKDLGDKVAAKASAEKTVALATEAKNDDYVRAANELMKKL